jgi:FlaA1/EpsC-like NDP-sugar epimerase
LNPRSLLAFAHDVSAAALAWAAAFWLRFNLDVPPFFGSVLLACLPWVALVHAAVFWAMGLYRGLWRFASLPDLRRILIAAGIAALAVPALLNLLRLNANVPRTAYLLAPVLLVLMMGGSRIAYRAWKEGRITPLIGRPQTTPVLVLGAGDAAAALLKDLASSREWRVVGVLDDDAGKHGGEIHGVKVLGPVDRIGEFARRLEVAQAIIAMPGASHEARKRAADRCVDARLEVMTVPALADIVAGRVSVSSLRHVELDDLLGRDPVEIDLPGLQSFVGGRTVMVTGAGGSIGAELCRQIAQFRPARLVLFDLAEFALYTVEQEFRDRKTGFDLVAAIGDAKNADRVREVMRRWPPQVVFHAAAYKHVPLMEDGNAFEAVRNNVLGTLTVARAAIEASADKFVLVSTDKAVNPTNVMGASKRLAELTCQALEARAGTQFVIVRFGNVLGSAGSVVPRFREQIARGGPVTVTHPEIRRYFMSIPEAAQLVLQAGLMGKAGEIFVLDMGEPVRIADLAQELIRLSGFADNEIEIVYTGLRPGEKLYEELLADTETTLPTPHPKLRVAKANAHGNGSLIEEVERWLDGDSATEPAAVRARLQAWVPEYAPSPAAPVIAGEVSTEQ